MYYKIGETHTYHMLHMVYKIKSGEAVYLTKIQGKYIYIYITVSFNPLRLL